MSAQKQNKQFKATARPRAGKGAARATRREGRVPAVIYGGKEPPLSISLDYVEVEKSIFAGHFLSTVFSIDVDGKQMRVIPRDYQLDPVRDFPTHVDFLRIVAGSKIRVDIPVHFKNNEASPGLKAGGVINIVEHSIELLCPPDEIPQEIMIDLTGLEIGDSIHINDIKLPENVTLRDKSNFTVATIAAPVKEEVIATTAPVAGVTEAAKGGEPAPAAGDAKAGDAKPAEAKGDKK
ncbi:MAG: 50S ribosomal protein L25/general stress protein Ctc [Pseudomonadota bacterium]